MLTKDSKIYVAGHRGMVGSALCRLLEAKEFTNLVTKTRDQLDLTDQQAVRDFMQQEKPDYVMIAAAKVGGIFANNEYPADFIYANLMMEANLINESYQVGVKDLLFLGSSCIYPKMATQPMTEKSLLTGLLESTNEPYAIAKIAGIKLCESYNRQHGVDYRSVMPTNLYGPNDNFHLENSHVVPALIRRFHEAKLNSDQSLSVWGTGNAKREFLHVDDMAAACFHVASLKKSIYAQCTEPMLSHINVGTGQDVTIKELAETIADVVGYQGDIEFDTTRPDGPPRKLMDVSRLADLGWSSTIPLQEGLKSSYHWYLENSNQFRA